jgi:hypothetical protein
LANPSTWVRVHGTLVIVWTTLVIPAVLLWRESIVFLVIVSVYANIAGSIASWQAARADCNSPNRQDLQRIHQGQRVHIAAVLALQREVKELRARIG